MSIGKRIIESRKIKNLNQKELADKIHISYSVMNRIESDNRPVRDEELNRIADVLEVSVDYLLGRTDTKHGYVAENQEEYMKTLKLNTPEQAIKFILEQPSIAAFGGYDLNAMTEDEIMDLANDILFAMKLSLERNKKQ